VNEPAVILGDNVAGTLTSLERRSAALRLRMSESPFGGRLRADAAPTETLNALDLLEMMIQSSGRYPPRVRRSSSP
jgi:hypothetical protein